MIRRSDVVVFSVLLAALSPASLVTGQTPAANGTPKPIDDTTQELYRQYIAPVGKIESGSVQAAVELVAARSEGVAEFQDLLRKEFAISRQEDGRRYDSRKLLWLITATLGREGAMRWQHEEAERTGFPAQRALPSRNDLDLESSLLADVIKFGRNCDRSEIDDFTIAVRQAHHPQGKQFLLDVLQNPNDRGNPSQSAETAEGKWPDNIGGSWDDARFHAAVGLAELGVEDGVEWLIERSKPNDFGIDGSVDRYRHALLETSSLRANCNAALSDLSGLPAKSEGGGIEWDKWWHESAASFVPRPVALKP